MGIEALVRRRPADDDEYMQRCLTTPRPRGELCFLGIEECCNAGPDAASLALNGVKEMHYNVQHKVR
jgi:hypothetical protein